MESYCKSNEELINYFDEAQPSVVASLVEILTMKDKILINRLGFNKELIKYCDTENIPAPFSEERKDLSQRLFREIKYFGSNTFIHIFNEVSGQKNGFKYNNLVKEITFKMKRALKSKVELPEIADCSLYEEALANMLIGKAFGGKTEEEMTQIFMEQGLEADAAKKAAKDFAKKGAEGGGLLLLVKILGKKKVKEILLIALVEVLKRILGRKIAEKIAEIIAKKVPQYVFRIVSNIIGVILIVKDIFDVTGGPATRITIPFVSLVAIQRTCQRMKEEA